MGAGDHDHDPGHGHEHEHHHDRPADFDWEAMADSLELDAAMMMPIVQDVAREMAASTDWNSVRQVIDVGCGPGVITAMLARQAPNATVTALDSSPPLLDRVRARSRAESLDGQITVVAADLELALPALAPADVVWASMVLHHVADPPAVLASLRDLLRPGGTLTMIEFAGPSAVLPHDDPLLSSGAWSRLETATAGVIRERLGLDPRTLDWPQFLSAAGFGDITDRVEVAYHDAPLADVGRRWVAHRVNRGLQIAGERLPAGDIAPFQDLADTAARRSDLFVRIERRVLTARRP